MYVYVAGSWEDREHVRTVMSVFELNGHIIIEDWTKHHNPEFGHIYAKKDLSAIENSDCFVLMLSEHKTSGKIFEFGFAVALSKTVFVFGDTKHASSVFFKLNGLEFFDDLSILIERMNEHERLINMKDGMSEQHE